MLSTSDCYAPALPVTTQLPELARRSRSDRDFIVGPDTFERSAEYIVGIDRYLDRGLTPFAYPTNLLFKSMSACAACVRTELTGKVHDEQRK